MSASRWARSVAQLDPVTQVTSVRALSTVASGIIVNQERVSWECPSMADMIRPCTDQDLEEILEVINDAAQAYKGVIPNDRFKDPYMPARS